MNTPSTHCRHPSKRSPSAPHPPISVFTAVFVIFLSLVCTLSLFTPAIQGADCEDDADTISNERSASTAPADLAEASHMPGIDPQRLNRGLLILAGVLAVAAFVAFLISLSAVRQINDSENRESEKKDADSQKSGHNQHID